MPDTSSKTIKNIKNWKNTLEQHLSVSNQPMLKKIPGLTRLQQTRKSSLLPMPPAPKVYILKNNIFQDHPHAVTVNNHYKHCISGPYSATSSEQKPPLLPNPFYHYAMPAHYEVGSIGPYQPQIMHFWPQIPQYVPVIMITLTNKFMHLIEQHTKLTHQQHHQNTSHQEQYLHKGRQTSLLGYKELCQI